MLQKKICLLGAFAVGKTSLVGRFVKSIFSDRYYTTVGVKIEKKTLQVDGQQCNLIVWDLAGEDEFMQVRMSYLRGSAGYLLVADGTRRPTLEAALNLHKRVREAIGNTPFVLVLNKADLSGEWELGNEIIEKLSKQGWTCLKASAKTGEGVEDAFLSLVSKMLER
ncbi:MAG TPA: Rab family GTPase [Candidatus Tectomicrobia bacterium]|nr:Rab family GTPase [Candidatus Tectomicrobia bacterium]